MVLGFCAAGSAPAQGVATPDAADAGGSARPAPQQSAAPRIGVEGQRTAELSLQNGGVVGEGDQLSGTVALANRVDEAASAGEIVIRIAPATIDTRYDLDSWWDPEEDWQLGTEVYRAPVSELEAGSTITLPVTLPESATELLEGGPFGARGISVQWVEGEDLVAEGRSTLVWDAESSAQPVTVSPIVPIVAPVTDRALLSIEELEELTAEEGRLTELLDAVEGSSATLAIDPRLLVSIRALGDDAPETALEWIERLEALENDSFPLEFADASLTLQQQAGLEEPLEPTDFSYETSQHEFLVEVNPDADGEGAGQDAEADAQETGAPTGTGEAGPTPPQTTGAADAAGAEPDATDPAGTAPEEAEADGEEEPETESVPPPGLEELLAFDYTRDDLQWPAAGTVSDLGALAEWRGGTVILDGAQVTLSPDRYATPSSQHRIGDTEVLVTDTQIDQAVADAVTAESPMEFQDGAAEVATLLSVVSRELPNEAREIVTTLPRSALEDPSRLGELLDQLDSHGWTSLAPAPAAASDPAALTETELLPMPHSEAAIGKFNALREAETRGIALSSLYEDPGEVTGELRAELLFALNGGLIQSDRWDTVSGSFVRLATDAADRISVVEGSEIQLIGHESSLPLFVENATDREVTVVVELRPTTGHLSVTDSATVVVPPGGVTRATLPVEAIANGVSGVEATLWTVDGTPLNSEADLVVNVNSTLESVAVVLLIGSGVVLFVLGVWRTLRRRRRERSEEVGQSSDG
ncbi:hypothetical protein FM112_09240 [Gulosibacter sp. 10]|nr:hypothetical protein FM112_09240 [Gulosibacter sp. 10]